ncbi:PAS domain S-box protein [Streptomyces sp. T1317-0309]|nr:PAS domain S-box protein [Streptomyces sp. T1317-0309]
MYAVDDEGTVIACNPGAERLLGYAPGTLIGVNAHRTLHPSNEESAAVPVQRPILQGVTGGKRTGGERAVLRRADGRRSRCGGPRPRCPRGRDAAVVRWSCSRTQPPSVSGKDAATSGTRSARRCASRPNTTWRRPPGSASSRWP